MSRPRKQGSSKWVKHIRGLASNPNDNDYLKVDYIDVNLNNSRKLIINLNNLTEASNQHVLKHHEVNESLIKLETARANLSWLGGRQGDSNTKPPRDQ